ncbi:MAG: sigma 54-interacting transcriptional regulator [Micropruina sp.]|uniref:sigma 54-interacting transcriptional regulator n=1 Tax=Micropruina sp. TaxID=2737536 RepID=UPI0039E30DA4
MRACPLPAQAKLLRVLQERTVTRLGSNREIPIDIRVVSATKEDLSQLSAEGQFRGDLCYRLIAAEITLLPLRARGHDAAILLFEHFMNRMAERPGRTIEPLTVQEADWILSYAWPGNVRQLKLLAERRALGFEWRPREKATAPADADASLPEQVDRFELRLIENALGASGGKTSIAAERLKIPLRTLNEKLKRLSGRREGTENDG